MKYLSIFVVVAAVVVGGYFLMRPPASSTPSPSMTPTHTVSQTPSGNITTHSVVITNFAFSPKQLTVKKGDIITFTNADSVQHTVTSLTGAFDSGLLSKNQAFQLKTASLAPGTYEYKCTPHSAMRGTIVVQ